MWCGCIVGNSSGSCPVCGVVGPWSLLRVDPGLNGTRFHVGTIIPIIWKPFYCFKYSYLVKIICE